MLRQELVVVQMAFPTYRRALLEEIASRGIPIRVLSGDRQFSGETADPDLPLVTYCGRNRFFLRGFFAWQPGVVGDAVRARAAIVEASPRILTTLAILLTRRLMRRPTWGWGHANARRGPQLRYNFGRRILQLFCDGLITYTVSDAKSLSKTFPSQKIIVAPNAMYSSSEMIPPVGGQRRDWLVIGRLINGKRPLLAVQSFEIAIPNLPADVRLHVVGDGPLMREVVSYVEAKQLGDRVRLHGRVVATEDLHEIFGACVGMIASGYVGLNVTQALGFGLPIVYPDREPHAPEIEALNSSNSIKVPALDASAFADAIVKMSAKACAGAYPADEISASARRSYSSETMADAFERVYDLDVRQPTEISCPPFRGPSGRRASVPLSVQRFAKPRLARAAELVGSSRFSFPAASGLDRIMAPLLPDSGTFLEVGANDGFTMSSTYHLEKIRGWTGILVGPVPRLRGKWQRLRPNSIVYCCACLDFSSAGRERSTIDSGPAAAVVGQRSCQAECWRLRRGARFRGHAGPARTLSSLIDDSQLDRITFMSVHVEGAELAVLSGVDLDRHCPDWMHIETKALGDIELLLESKMGLFSRLSHHGYLFKSNDSNEESSLG